MRRWCVAVNEQQVNGKRQMMEKGYLRMPAAIMFSPAISMPEKFVLCVLLDFIREDWNRCAPSWETIAKRACLSRSTLHRVLTQLKKRDLVDWDRTKKSSLYRINFDKCIALFGEAEDLQMEFFETSQNETSRAKKSQIGTSTKSLEVSNWDWRRLNLRPDSISIPNSLHTHARVSPSAQLALVRGEVPVEGKPWKKMGGAGREETRIPRSAIQTWGNTPLTHSVKENEMKPEDDPTFELPFSKTNQTRGLKERKTKNAQPAKTRGSTPNSSARQTAANELYTFFSACMHRRGLKVGEAMLGAEARHASDLIKRHGMDAMKQFVESVVDHWEKYQAVWKGFDSVPNFNNLVAPFGFRQWDSNNHCVRENEAWQKNQTTKSGMATDLPIKVKFTSSQRRE